MMNSLLMALGTFVLTAIAFTGAAAAQETAGGLDPQPDLLNSDANGDGVIGLHAVDARSRLNDIIESADDDEFAFILRAAQCATPTITDPLEARNRLYRLMDDPATDFVAVYDHVLGDLERWDLVAVVEGLQRELHHVSIAAWGPPKSVCDLWERLADACWERYEDCQEANEHSRRPCQNIKEECEGWDEDLKSCEGGDDGDDGGCEDDDGDGVGNNGQICGWPY